MKNKNDFPKIHGKMLLNEPLSGHTSFCIGGPCTLWAEAGSGKELKNMLRFAGRKQKKIFIMGMGSNVLVNDMGFNGVVIHPGKGDFKNVLFTKDGVRAGAGVELSHLVDLACRRGMGGMEGLAGIPGSVGGAVFMNAGYRGNIADCLKEVRVLDKKSAKTLCITREKIRFSYRHSGLGKYIIMEAAFVLKKRPKEELLRRKKILIQERKLSQPSGRPSAGCAFRNPAGKMPAGYYIESAGLKGKRIGGAQVSLRHANFIVNTKKAKAKDVLRLIGVIKKRVRARFGVNLVSEIVIL